MLQPDLETSLEALSQRVEALEKRPVQRVISQSVNSNDSSHNENKTVISAESLQEKIKDELPQTTLESPQIEQVIDEVTPQVAYETADDISNNDDLEDLWEDVLSFVKNEKIATHALLIDGHFEGIVDNSVCVSYGEGYGFHMIAIEKAENKELVERGVFQVYGRQLRVKYIIKNQDDSNLKETMETDEEKLYNFLGEHKNKLEFQD
jgi:DNA polymerase-3 subunit gamma/tau